MIESLVSLPVVFGSLVFMAFAVAIGLPSYFVSHKLISRFQTSDMKEATGNLFRVVGLLVSLLLALTFAEVLSDLHEAERAVKGEGAAIGDIAGSLELYGLEETREALSLIHI